MEYNFFDSRGMVHDKPCPDGIASSGNPAIYSVILETLTGELIDYKEVFFKEMLTIKVMGNDISIIRHPEKPYVTSPDELVAHVKKGYITAAFLKQYGWKYHDTLHSPGTFRIFQAAVYCWNKDRNFFKDANVRDAHPFTYSTPPYIRHFALRKAGKWFTGYEILYYLWLLSVLLKRNYKGSDRQTGVISQKNIAWVILKDLKSPLAKLINYKKNLKDYFIFKEHPALKFIESLK